MGYRILFKQCGSDHMTRGRQGCRVTGIAVHYTGTTASARANAIYFARNRRQGASAHYFVDGIGDEIYQSVRDEDTAWAVGSWSENLQTISIEVVSAGEDFEVTEVAKTAWLVQRLMARYGVPASRVIRHYDVTGKLCPAPYIDTAKWARLKSQLINLKEDEVTEAEIQRIADLAAQKVWACTSGRETYDRVRRSTQIIKIACGLPADSMAEPRDREEDIREWTIGRLQRCTAMLKALCGIGAGDMAETRVAPSAPVRVSEQDKLDIARMVHESAGVR